MPARQIRRQNILAMPDTDDLLTSGWQMDQQNPPAAVQHPRWPILAGVNGNYTSGLRRFAGFRRLDYDLREDSTLTDTSFGLVAEAGGSTICFKAVQLDRISGDPVYGFLIAKFVKASHVGQMTFYYRASGDDTLDALQKSRLDTLVVDTFKDPDEYDLALSALYNGRIPGVGAVAIGRLLFVNHEVAGHPYVFYFLRSDAGVYTLAYKRAGALGWTWPSGFNPPVDLGPSAVPFAKTTKSMPAYFRDMDVDPTEADFCLFEIVDNVSPSSLQIDRVKLNGSYVTLDSYSYTPTGFRAKVSCDPINDQVYSLAAGVCRRINYAGTGLATSVFTTDVDASDIYIRPSTRLLYFVRGGNVGELCSVNCASSLPAATVLVKTFATVTYARLLAIDDTNGIVYLACYTPAGLSYIGKYNLAAGTETILLNLGKNEVTSLHFDSTSGLLFFNCDRGLFRYDPVNLRLTEIKVGRDPIYDSVVVACQTKDFVLWAPRSFADLYYTPFNPPDVDTLFNYAPHNVESKVSVRIRFANKTTGFVGPMSEQLDLTLFNESGIQTYANGDVAELLASVPTVGQGIMIDGVYFGYGQEWPADAGSASGRCANLVAVINQFRDVFGYPRVTASVSSSDNSRLRLTAVRPGVEGNNIAIDSNSTSVVLRQTVLSGGGAGRALRRRIRWALASTAELPESAVKCLAQGTPGESTPSQELVIQVFCTQSTEIDNPAHGLGVFYLDHEIPLTQIGTTYETPTPKPALPREHAATNPPTTSAGYSGVPQLSNAELALQDLWDVEADGPNEIAVGAAFGELSGLLLSLSGAETSNASLADVSRNDIRVSPPTKSIGVWLESVVTRIFQRVTPKPVLPPDFLTQGDFAYFHATNRMVRAVRTADRVVFNVVPSQQGPVSREAIAAASGNRIFLATEAGVVQLDVTTNGVQAVLAVQRLVQQKWASQLKAGRILVGYDPLLDAIFISPKANNPENDTVTRSECVILWLRTLRVTMLYDCYWVGMTTGTDPRNGKARLFILDAGGHILYPEDLLVDSDSDIASMTGIRKVESGGLVYGGVCTGKITSIAAGKYYDSSCSTAGRGTFDRLSYLAAGPTRTFTGALAYSRVYFFRSVTFNDGNSAIAVVADALITANGLDYFELSDIQYRRDPRSNDPSVLFTSILQNDQYSIAPVVMQIVSAPIFAADVPESATRDTTTVNRISFALTDLAGFAPATATTYPTGLPDYMRNAFIGVVESKHLQNLPLGVPIYPVVAEPSPVTEDIQDSSRQGVARKGRGPMVVFTHYGTNYRFTVLALHTKAVLNTESNRSAT